MQPKSHRGTTVYETVQSQTVTMITLKKLTLSLTSSLQIECKACHHFAINLGAKPLVNALTEVKQQHSKSANSAKATAMSRWLW